MTILNIWQHQTNIQSEKMKYLIGYPNHSYDDIKPLYINLLKVN